MTDNENLRKKLRSVEMECVWKAKALAFERDNSGINSRKG